MKFFRGLQANWVAKADHILNFQERVAFSSLHDASCSKRSSTERKLTSHVLREASEHFVSIQDSF